MAIAGFDSIFLTYSIKHTTYKCFSGISRVIPVEIKLMRAVRATPLFIAVTPVSSVR